MCRPWVRGQRTPGSLGRPERHPANSTPYRGFGVFDVRGSTHGGPIRFPRRATVARRKKRCRFRAGGGGGEVEADQVPDTSLPVHQGWYNPGSRHSALGCHSPHRFDAKRRARHPRTLALAAPRPHPFPAGTPELYSPASHRNFSTPREQGGARSCRFRSSQLSADLGRSNHSHPRTGPVFGNPARDPWGSHRGIHLREFPWKIRTKQELANRQVGKS